MPFLMLWLMLPSLASASPIPSYAGKVIRWDLSPTSANLDYYIDSSVSATMAGWARDGFTMWQAVSESYISFTEVGSAADAEIVVKGYASISTAGIPMQAATRFDGSAHLTSCEVQVVTGADSDPDYLTTYLQSSMIHEVGHCLGLAHSITMDAVMSYRSGSPLTLADDDRFALALLYPQDGETKYPMGCATTSSKPPGGPGGPTELAGLFGFMAIGWLLGRRRNNAA